MSIELSYRDLIVVPKAYMPLLYSFKSENSTLSAKIIDEEGLLDLLSFHYVKNPLPYFLSQGIDVARGKQLMKLLRRGYIEEGIDITPYIDFDPLGKKQASRGTIYLLELDEDIALKKMINEAGLNFVGIHLADLGINPRNSDIDPVIFKDRFTQYSFIFSDLRTRLLNGARPNDFAIVVSNEDEYFYCETLGELFGIKTRYKKQKSLFDFEETRLAIEEIKDARRFDAYKDFQFSDELKSIIDEYKLADLDFDFAFSNLKVILKSRLLSEEGDRGVLVTRTNNIDPNRLIYITSFEKNTFYPVYADTDYLSDARLSSLGLNASYVRTSLAKREKLNYLKYSNIVLLSRVKQHLDDKIHPSPLLEEFPDAENKPKKERIIDEVPLSGHTSKSVGLSKCARLDDSFYKGPLGELRAYDSRYKGIKDFHIENDKWSVTNLETYISCPFRYLLKLILPEEYGDAHYAALGQMVHAFLEGIDEEDFDFESAFSKGKQTYEKMMLSHDQLISGKEEVFIEAAKRILKRIYLLIASRRRHCKSDHSYSEHKLTWTLTDGQKDYKFVGYADKIEFYHLEDKEYFVILDYKTGMEEFRPFEAFLGKSTQLPLYAWACLNNLDNKVTGELGGLGLQHVYFSSTKSTFVETRKTTFESKTAFKKLEINGVFLADEALFGILDDTAFSKGECTFKGKYVNSNGCVYGTKDASISGLKESSPYDIDDLLSDAVKSTIDTIHKIESGEFPIAPAPNPLNGKATGEDDNFPCARCAYSDICYLDRSRDRKSYSLEIAEHFRKEVKTNG